MKRFLAALAAATILAGTPALADTLIDNVEGMTVDVQGQVTRFSAILIGNDGRIVQVLAREPRPTLDPGHRVEPGQLGQGRAPDERRTGCRRRGAPGMDPQRRRSGRMGEHRRAQGGQDRGDDARSCRRAHCPHRRHDGHHHRTGGDADSAPAETVRAAID